ncbi:MAG: T9SS type A sorting domain-containing protein [Chryseolinea sp.]
MKRIFLVLFISIVANVVKGQTSTTAGAWTTGGNWSTGTAPSTGSLSTNVIINKAMTFNSGSITGWGSTTITITTGGSLAVTGNFTLTGSGVNITVQSGGSLSVSGITTVTNGARITIAGGATPGSATFNTLAATSNGMVTINAGASVTAVSLSTSSNSDAIIDNRGTLTVNGSVSSSGVITNSGTMQINGSFTQNNTGNSLTNSGSIQITGNVAANGQIQLNPGSVTDSNMIITGTLTVNANPWMIVGTTTASPCGTTMTIYANLVVKSDLILTGSGDVTVNQNGRMAVFGNITRTSGGGTVITINCGGQVYVNGNIDLGSGGGNTVTNSNSGSSPTGSNGSPVIGLYVNGTTTAQNVSGTVGTKSDLQANDLPFFTWIGTIPNGPLPIKLLYFKVKEVITAGVSLQWVTTMEKNFEKFLIERADQNLNFEVVGEINAKGGLDITTQYNFLDASPKYGKNYYRLKSVDFDRTFEYSNVIYAEWGFENQEIDVTVYPNPVINHSFTMEMNHEVTSDANIIVINSMGEEIIQQSILSNKQEISLQENLKPGIYFLKISGEKFSRMIKILIP